MEGLEAVGEWTAAMKSEEGREHFLESGGLEQAAQTFKDAVADARPPAQLVPLCRLLRNCVPLGPPAVETLLDADVVGTACRLVCSALPEPQPASGPAAAPAPSSQSPSSPHGAEMDEATLQLLAAATQLLANLANSGAEAAEAVWAAGWSAGALLRLVAHPSGKLHEPAALILYACCRQCYDCSRALCGLAGSSGSSGSSRGDGQADGCSSSGRSSQPAAAAAVAATSASCTAPNHAGAGAGAGAEEVGAARAVWEALLRRQLEDHRRQAAGGGGPRDGGHQANSQQWTSLLVGCVALRQGLLQPLLALLSSGCSSPGAAPAPAAVAAAGTAPAAEAAAVTPAAEAAEGTPGDDGAAAVTAARGFLCPLVLHLVAVEMLELKGGTTVDLESSEKSPISRIQAGSSAGAEQLPPPPPPVARPLCAALLCAAEVAVAAARACAWRGAASGSAAAAGVEGRAGSERGQQQGQGQGQEEAAPLEAVLEAALEVLKSVTQREDGGRALAGGMDLAEWLLLTNSNSISSSHGVVTQASSDGAAEAAAAGAPSAAAAGAAAVTVAAQLLGMLAALQPAAAARTKARSTLPPPMVMDLRTGAAEAAPPPPEGAPPQDRPVVELPAALERLAVGFPAGASATPYIGYRGDLVAVVANGCFRRPTVTSAVVRMGGLELLLAQTHLDERSPLAREWALWGVRNMAEGSEEVQARIAGLELQTTVETPELQQLGLRLELDKATGKMKVTKTEEAEEVLRRGAPPPPPQ